MQLSLNYELFN